jgi:hypothetical protein
MFGHLVILRRAFRRILPNSRCGNAYRRSPKDSPPIGPVGDGIRVGFVLDSRA